MGAIHIWSLVLLLLLSIFCNIVFVLFTTVLGAIVYMCI